MLLKNFSSWGNIQAQTDGLAYNRGHARKSRRKISCILIGSRALHLLAVPPKSKPSRLSGDRNTWHICDIISHPWISESFSVNKSGKLITYIVRAWKAYFESPIVPRCRTWKKGDRAEYIRSREPSGEGTPSWPTVFCVAFGRMKR